MGEKEEEGEEEKVELTFDERIKGFSVAGELHAKLDLSVSTSGSMGLPPLAGWNTARMPLYVTEDQWYMTQTGSIVVEGAMDIVLGDAKRPFARLASTLSVGMRNRLSDWSTLYN